MLFDFEFHCTVFSHFKVIEMKSLTKGMVSDIKITSTLADKDITRPSDWRLKLDKFRFGKKK